MIACNFSQYVKSKATHWVGRTGNEYPKDEYNNHGFGGVYRGFKDLPLNEYPYTFKYKIEFVWKVCRECSCQNKPLLPTHKVA